MVFAYYNRLTLAEQRIYRKSDEVNSIHLTRPSSLQPLVGTLDGTLKRDDRPATKKICQDLVSALTANLKVPPVEVEVLATRPSRSWGELQGLYNPGRGRKAARITVWMRTAQRRQVVAFRSFLRTLLHEICHHLDYELLRLADSFHTEGFYKRESSLFHQLVANQQEDFFKTRLGKAR
jgi:hypothetical protein